MSREKFAHQVHLRTIYTEGAPHDGGKNLKKLAESFEHSFAPFYASVGSLSPRDLKKYRPDLTVTNYEPELKRLSSSYPDLRYNPAWARVGYLGWKPAAILHWLESGEIPFGHLLVYRDVDIRRYPEYLENRREFVKWVFKKSENRDLVLFSDYSRPYSRDIRPDLLGKAPKVMFSEVLFPRPIWAGLIAVRNTSTAREFIREWSRRCTPESLTPFFHGPVPSDFIWHSGEQSILNLLSLESGASSMSWRKRVRKIYLFESRKAPRRNQATKFFLAHTIRAARNLWGRLTRLLKVD